MNNRLHSTKEVVEFEKVNNTKITSNYQNFSII